MKFLPALPFLSALALLAASPAAHANLQLAQKNNCMACHGVDKKVVGPAYQDVAKKYTGQKDAQAQLVASIQKGGSGRWGPVPMPPQPTLSEADAKALAGWILAGAK
ncbi:c-type cytochrome [Inhella proteolytica]|uniref:C-type cytochrome n=1 Tax=Inhella proteolytica TaxID=2795029 RepID=A0A931J7A4_9BURK|nr:c-type cytochrome [Inhella proteolytica]MBH9578127.1 c-type cytochrome [Inhella proteolytica]